MCGISQSNIQENICVVEISWGIKVEISEVEIFISAGSVKEVVVR